MSNTSASILAAMENVTLNEKGAIAFKSTKNPILDLFTETRKKIPETIDEFTILIRKIEAAKNFDSEMFVKMLKFHRLIEKGNGMKGVYYMCMMVLKEEDPVLYEKILSWSHEYPKDILRLARLSSMFGGKCNIGNSDGNVLTIAETKSYKHNKNKPKTGLSKKMTTWVWAGMRTNIISNTTTNSVDVIIPTELELYSQLLAKVIKKILSGNLYDEDVNLMLFKYLSYEGGHFAVESKVIWTRVKDILKSEYIE
jgi:hypothetical protein